VEPLKPTLPPDITKTQSHRYQKMAEIPGAIKILAEYRLGEMLKETVQQGGDRKSKFHDETLIGVLPEGVSKTQSHRYQKMAEIPGAIKILAEHRLGEMLKETVDHRGARGVGFTMEPTLPPDITKTQSHRYQKMAGISLARIEEYIGPEAGENHPSARKSPGSIATGAQAPTPGLSPPHQPRL
jgi:truncated hemoglobin YjbI